METCMALCISGFMSVGLTNLTGIVYAQLGNTADIAAYLLSMRVISQIREISMAPFYSKIPLMAVLRVKNETKELIKIIQKGMFLSHMVFIVSCIGVGVCSPYLLRTLHSQTPFVSPIMWFLLSFAFFVHRFGAMHVQVYTTTNHIISHIADGISGIIYLGGVVVLYTFIGLYAIPIAMLLGYFGFYAWYAAKYSYKSLNISFWNFEKKVIILPLTLILLYFSFMVIQFI